MEASSSPSPSLSPWTCSACTFSNSNQHGLACEICFSPRTRPPQRETQPTMVSILPVKRSASCSYKGSGGSSSGDSTGTTLSASDHDEQEGLLESYQQPHQHQGLSNKSISSARQYADVLSSSSSSDTENDSHYNCDDDNSNSNNNNKDLLHIATDDARDAECAYFYSIQQETLRRNQVAQNAKIKANQTTQSLSSVAQTASSVLLDSKTLESILSKQDYYDQVATGGAGRPAHRHTNKQLHPSDSDKDDGIIAVPYTLKLAFLIGIAILAWHFVNHARYDVFTTATTTATTTDIYTTTSSTSTNTNPATIGEYKYDRSIGLYGFSTYQIRNESSALSQPFLEYTLQQEAHFVTPLWQVARLWYRYVSRIAAIAVVVPSMFIMMLRQCCCCHDGDATMVASYRLQRTILMTFTVLMAMSPWVIILSIFRSPLCNVGNENAISLNYQSFETDIEMNFGNGEDDDDAIRRTLHIFYATDATTMKMTATSNTLHHDQFSTCQPGKGMPWLVVASLLWIFVTIGVWKFVFFLPTQPSNNSDNTGTNKDCVPMCEQDQASGLQPLWDKPIRTLNTTCAMSIVALASMIPYWKSYGILAQYGSYHHHGNAETSLVITTLLALQNFNPKSQDIPYSTEQQEIVAHLFGFAKQITWIPFLLIACPVVYIWKVRITMWLDQHYERLGKQRREQQQMNHLLSVWFFSGEVTSNEVTADDLETHNSPFLRNGSPRLFRASAAFFILGGLMAWAIPISIHSRSVATGICPAMFSSGDKFMEFAFEEVLLSSEFEGNFAIDSTSNETATSKPLSLSFEAREDVPRSFWMGTTIEQHDDAYTSCRPTQYGLLLLLAGFLAITLGVFGVFLDQQISEAHEIYAALYPGAASKFGLHRHDKMTHDSITNGQDAIDQKNTSLCCGMGSPLSASKSMLGSNPTTTNKSKRNSAEIDRTPINIVV